jgi:hypothetical protein
MYLKRQIILGRIKHHEIIIQKGIRLLCPPGGAGHLPSPRFFKKKIIKKERKYTTKY